jgi:hypothetical protein
MAGEEIQPTSHVAIPTPELLCEAIDTFELVAPLELLARTAEDLGAYLVDAWTTPVRFGSALKNGSFGETDGEDALSIARYFRIQRGDANLGIDCGSIGLELVDKHSQHPSGGVRVLRAQIFTQSVAPQAALVGSAFAIAEDIIDFLEDGSRAAGVHRMELLTFDSRMARVLAHRGYQVAGAPLAGAIVKVLPVHQQLNDLRQSNSVLPFADHWVASRKLG